MSESERCGTCRWRHDGRCVLRSRRVEASSGATCRLWDPPESATCDGMRVPPELPRAQSAIARFQLLGPDLEGLPTVDRIRRAMRSAGIPTGDDDE